MSTNTTKPPFNTHPCALCNRQIGTGWLMCPQHWRLVPVALQNDVYGTWRRLQAITSLAERHQPAHVKRVRDDYFAARDAAIDSARAAIAAPAGLPVAVKPSTLKGDCT